MGGIMRGALLVAAALLAACAVGPSDGGPTPPAAGPASSESTPPRDEPAPPDPNPRVAPGLVVWHADFDAARAASARSGKPVLLFAMLGDLDRELC
jgi:predicted outer membrane protein